MAASHTLSHSFAIPQISKLGVLTLHGYGLRIRVQAGQLETEHGIGPERYKLRLPRVNHRLKRLVCIGDDGFVTLAALRWLSDVGASFVMLDRLGKVRVVTGPASPSEARLRRAQALALANGTGLPISRELIGAKLDGQELVVREKLKNESTASVIATLRKNLPFAETIDAIRGIESRAASEYWGAWYDIPILFTRNDAKRVPDHWLRFGTRHSVLSGGPRRASNCANALLNYTNAVAESECRLAAVACGLDPGLGFIHTDTANRDSLALDLIEPVRPAIEAWLLNWLSTEPLRRSDFLESSDGNCRLSSTICSELSRTAPTWAKLVAPWAEFVAHSLYGGRASRTRCLPGIKTPLTQTHRREAKDASAKRVSLPKAVHICRGCGSSVHRKSAECWKCAQSTRTITMRDVARLGRLASQQPEAEQKRMRTASRQALARFSWDSSQLPSWLTRDFFFQQIHPLLATVSASQIRSALDVSHYYATKIRKGYLPHPRHWQYPSVTVMQNAQPGGGTTQTRVYVYDRGARLIQETNPENGTTSYSYDSATGCTGTYNGDLVKKVDNKTPTANVSCYAYDSLHRITSIVYSGPDSGNTPTKTFVYDAATFNGTLMSYPKGRLAEAYTGASGSKTTDEFFSYSVRGELTDTWECTPHSGANGCGSVSNYYHATAGFWANGALNTLTSSISGLPAQTYGVDSMGRGNSVTAGAGQNPVNSTIYDLSNFKTTITFGSLDSDVFTYYSNTGRMNTYQFTVGTTVGQNTDTGTTNWNQNGSLASLAIVDQIPGTNDTQTCNFTHDDLSRISSAGCGTNWNQQFTYDAFGNITKNSSGPGITFQPGYDHSKNWITSLPGSITTQTDANGRMTYDGVHNYLWDVEGKMISVDTTTITHDALGRMVETAVGSSYTQVVYSPLGRFALMNGQTLAKAFVPLPTGATAVYTSASLNTTSKVAYYRHHDNLGSSRLASTPSRILFSSTAYAPYGEPYAQAGTTDLSFTGQDQDTVAGMHDFTMRKFVPVQGRWLSPDPAGLAAADMSSPQTWNRYGYLANNPLSFVDPLGLNRAYPGQCQGGEGLCDWEGGGGDPTSFGGLGGYALWGIYGYTENGDGPWGIIGWFLDWQGSNNGDDNFINDVVNSALKQPKLGRCLNKWIGPGTVLTNANLPIVDFRNSSAQLDQMLARQGFTITPGTLGTIKTPVPSTGRGTLYIASEQWGDLNASMRTFVHETGNLLAIQQFTNVPGNPTARAYDGALGTPPGPDQTGDPFGDPDIGEQMEECVFGGRTVTTTITVTP